MHASSTYQAILDKGRAETIAKWRASLRKIGEKRLGALSKKNEKRLNAIRNEDRLGRMTEQIHGAANWDDLLNTP